MVRWILERSRLQEVADALARQTTCDGIPPHTYRVSADGSHLEYQVRTGSIRATVRFPVSETEDLINLHLPSSVAYIRKEQLLHPNPARLGN